MRPLPTLASTAAALVLAASHVSPARAFDTIDCQRDTSLAERTICSSQRLQVLDAQVTERYTDLMLDSHIRSGTKRALHASQIDFLHRRDRCGSDAQCLAEVMGLRMARIDTYR